MKHLLFLLALLPALLLAQGPVQFQGGGPDKASPLVVTGPDTIKIEFDSLYGFNYDSKAPDFYDEASCKLAWSRFGEVMNVRIGGEFQVPGSSPYCKFGFYTSTGTGEPYTRIGKDFNVGYHRGWEELNEGGTVAAGSSILSGDAGVVYLIVEQGTVELSDLNILIQRTEGNDLSDVYDDTELRDSIDSLRISIEDISLTAGPQGPQGIQGPAGPSGVDGQDGADGLPGVPGTNGADGVDGAQGPQGLPGADGVDGAVGPQGDPGPQGSAGADGSDGLPGVPGTNGSDGSDGAVGPQGPQGDAGPQGSAGADGVDGADGADGVGIAQTVSQFGSTFTLSDGGGSINLAGTSTVTQDANAIATTSDYQQSHTLLSSAASTSNNELIIPPANASRLGYTIRLHSVVDGLSGFDNRIVTTTGDIRADDNDVNFIEVPVSAEYTVTCVQTDVGVYRWLLDRGDEPPTAYVTDVIWAEESGAISSNGTNQFSFGNGATGVANFGLPIWEDMIAVGMVFNAEIAGTSLTVRYTVNDVVQTEELEATTNTTVTYFRFEQDLSQGDLVSFGTGVEVGAWTDARVGLIVKKQVKYD